MKFAKTTIDDFAIIKNGVDDRIEIIQHVDTGFYNITKMLKLVDGLKREDAKTVKGHTTGILVVSGKQVNHWFATQSTTELIKFAKRYTRLDCVRYELKSGTPKRFWGTYVHRKLYDHFMIWLDKEYAFKVYEILDRIHTEANARIIAEKDDKIAELLREMRKQSAKMDAQSKQMDTQSDEIHELKEMNREVLGYAKDTKATLNEVQEELGDTKDKLDDVQDDLTETKENVKRTKDILEEKCKVSTQNPTHERDHHYFAVTVRDMVGDVRQFIYTTGSKHYVDRTITQLVADGYKITIPMFYNANGFDLRKNCQTAFKKFLKQRLDAINRERAIADSVFNTPLNVEIRAHNRKYRKQPTKKRSFQNEKRTTKQLKPKDIPIRYRVRTCEYHDNPYISFDDVRQIVIDTNMATQKSPLADKE